LIRRRRRRVPKARQRRRRAPTPSRWKHPVAAAAAAARQGAARPHAEGVAATDFFQRQEEGFLAELPPLSSQREPKDGKTSLLRRKRARRAGRGQTKKRVARWPHNCPILL